MRWCPWEAEGGGRMGEAVLTKPPFTNPDLVVTRSVRRRNQPV